MRVLLLGLLLAAPIAAQPDVAFGLRGGVVYSDLNAHYPSFDGSVGLGGGVGFEIAGFAETPLSNRFALAAELGLARGDYSYSIGTARRANNESGFIDDGEVTLRSAFRLGTLGVLGRYTLLRQRALTPYVFGGPRLNVLIGVDQGRVMLPPSPHVGDGTPTPIVEAFADRLGDVSLSGELGVGVEAVRPAGVRFRAEASYDRSVTSFFNVDPDAVFGVLSGFGASVAVLW